MTYRDPLAGLRSQVAVKRAVLVDREREVPPVLRALLPEETRASIAGLRAAANAERDAKVKDEDDARRKSRRPKAGVT